MEEREVLEEEREGEVEREETGVEISEIDPLRRVRAKAALVAVSIVDCWVEDGGRRRFRLLRSGNSSTFEAAGLAGGIF
jgi:hypothetical protein